MKRAKQTIPDRAAIVIDCDKEEVSVEIPISDDPAVHPVETTRANMIAEILLSTQHELLRELMAMSREELRARRLATIVVGIAQHRR